jgi:hypothetical protein
MLYNANGSFLYCKDNYGGMLNDYFQNIIKLIQLVFENTPELKINVILHDYCDNPEFNNYEFNNSNKTLNIKVNIEHTLVKSGWRDVYIGSPFGEVNDTNNEKYLVHIGNYIFLNNSDIVIDYSNPNIYNVKTCPQYNSFSKKHIYISSCVYEPCFTKENRNILTLTTFFVTNDPSRPRRNEFLNKINDKMKHTNINNCFEKELGNIFKKTKILINIHQTPHHDTFEELRVLPALECGVIVISEKSPLAEMIPYKDLIIWADYDDIVEKTEEIINNYDYFHDIIFSIENRNLLSNLQQVNYEVLYNAIIEKNVL